MIDDIKSAIESANTIALAGMRTGEEIGRRESAVKIAKLREALSLYITFCGNTGYSLTRESAKLAYDTAQAALNDTEQGR